MSDFKERLIVEISENSEKIGKLKSFLVSDQFETLCARPQDLIEIQLLTMRSLDVILRKRLALVE